MEQNARQRETGRRSAGSRILGPMRLLPALLLAAAPASYVYGAEGGAAPDANRAAPAAGPAHLPTVEPSRVGLLPGHLQRIDDVVAEGLEAGRMAGCVVAVGRRGKLAWLKAYGDRQQQPRREAMTVDTVFDLASLTKPIATASAVMLLVERGELRLGTRAGRVLPEFARQGKETITIHQLLTHQGGLIPDNALSDYRDGPEKAWERICDLTPRSPPGEKFVYSDVGFIVLGRVVEKVSGRDLAEFTASEIFEPLGMVDTGFLPGAQQRLRAAATEQRDGEWMKGQVHDPRAFQLGGVAGHAGLFSTAHDLAVFAQMMLRRGRYRDARIFGPRTVAVMTDRHRVSSGLRGLGWDKQSAYSTNRGDLLSERAFGHGGFTGTSFWVDPQLDLFVIFLGNRLHPDGEGEVNTLAGRIANIAAAAIEVPAAGPRGAARQ